MRCLLGVPRYTSWDAVRGQVQRGFQKRTGRKVPPVSGLLITPHGQDGSVLLLTEVSSHPEQQKASAPANPANETTTLSDSASATIENVEPVTNRSVARNMPSYTIWNLTRILRRKIPEIHTAFRIQTNHPFFDPEFHRTAHRYSQSSSQ